MSIETFQHLIQQVTDHIGQRPLNNALQDDLNQTFPANGKVFNDITQACRTGMAEGWICQHKGGGIRYGRVIKPAQALNGYSVDVVDMKDLAGPHHRHPNGEIDLIMPIDETAQFDNHPAGWLVYGPGTAHSPTVSQGQALVLYLLPEGKIEFTR